MESRINLFTSLEEVMQASGSYPLNKTGFCVGYGRAAIHGYYADKLANICERTNKLITKKEWLSKLAQQVKEKTASAAEKNSFNKEEKYFIESFAPWLNSIQISHRPHLFKRFLGQSASQHDIKIISKVTNSQQLETQGDITEIDRFLLSCTQPEVGLFFNLLHSIFQQYNTPITFSFNSVDHFIDVFWENGEWYVIDIGNIPREVKSLADFKVPLEELIQTIYNYFNISTDRILFEPILYGLESQKELLKTILNTIKITDQFKQLEKTTYTKLVEYDSNNASYGYMAAKFGNEAITKEITTTHGIHPYNITYTTVKEDGTTATTNALETAIFMNNSNIIKVYGDCKVDLHLPNMGDQLFPIHKAALSGFIDIIDALVKYGANVNQIIFGGIRPIHYAIEVGHADVVKHLISLGANYNKVNNENWHPIHLAAANGHADVINVLLEYKVNTEEVLVITGQGNFTAAYLAAQNGHLEALRTLINAGVEFNTKTSFGTALFAAARNGHTEVVKYLLEKDADMSIGVPIDMVRTFIKGNIECEKRLEDFLIRKIPKQGANTKNSLNPCEIACVMGHIEIAQLLIEKAKKITAARNIYGILPSSSSSSSSNNPLCIPNDTCCIPFEIDLNKI